MMALMQARGGAHGQTHGDARGEAPAGVLDAPSRSATRILHHEPSPPALAPRALAVAAGSLHVLTCGSVDDGKSTLIGRMLWDANALTTDQQVAIEKAPLTPAGTPDFSRLLDGLAAEREQGITIDIA